jgi:hypothetical protein
MEVAQDGESVSTGQDQVEKDQVEFLALRQGQASGPVAGLGCCVPRESERVHQAAPNRRVVFDDQDSC